MKDSEGEPSPNRLDDINDDRKKLDEITLRIKADKIWQRD